MDFTGRIRTVRNPKTLTAENPPVSSKDGINTASFQIKGLAVLSLFHERGLVTGQAYQPAMNHRKLDFTTLSSVTKKDDGTLQDPLLQSLTLPKIPADKFDNIAPICLFFYDLEDDRHQSDVVHNRDSLKTHNSVLIDRDLLEKNVLKARALKKGFLVSSKLLPGYIRGKKAKPLSMKTFRRVCRIFGYIVVDGTGKELKDADKVQLAHLIAFANLFATTDVSTPDGFKKFIGDFHLDDFFEYVDSKGITGNARSLSEVLRGLAKMRAGAFEGQHRWVALAQVFAGYFEPTNAAPLPRDVVFEEAYPLSSWSDIQLFSKLLVNIGEPKNKETEFLGVLEILHDYGKVVTDASKRQVQTGWPQVMEAMGDTFESAFGTIVPLKYDNYWASDQSWTHLLANQRVAWTAIVRYFNHHPAANEMARGSIMGKDRETYFDRMGDRFVNFRSITHKIPPKASPGFAENFAVSMEMLRYACHDRDTFTNLMRVFTLNKPECRQRFEIMEYASRFRDINWLKKTVMTSSLTISEVYNKRMVVESYVIYQLRHQKLNEEVLARIRTLDFTDIDTNKLFPKLPASAVTKRQPLWSNLMGNSQDVKLKWEHAVSLTLFNDAIETILKRGHNPDFERRKPKNYWRHRSLVLQNYLDVLT